jgi:hypothetical protein
VVGNLWERTGNQGEGTVGCVVRWPADFGNDTACAGFPFVWPNGGNWESKTDGGVFATALGSIGDSGNSIGFRCGR